MNLASLNTAFIAVALSSCGTAPSSSAGAKEKQPTESVSWTRELRLPSLAAMDSRLLEPFDETLYVEHDGRYSVTNCADFLALRGDYTPVDERTAQSLKSVGVDCKAIVAIRKARKPRVDYFGDFRLDSNAVNLLPAVLGPVPDRNANKVTPAETRDKSWKDFYPSLRASVDDQGALIVELPGWIVRVREYARGDFDGDGIEDLLVRDDAADLQGANDSERLLLLTRRSSDGKLEFLLQF